jgi:hypothetical protein
MVKIISRNTWKKQINCETCQSSLEIDSDDVKLGRFNTAWYAGDSGELKYYIECPVCDGIIHLNDDEVPRGVRKKLEDSVK